MEKIEMANKASDLIPQDEALELFDGACDSQLKFFDAPESYEFGQFVDLLVKFDNRLHQMTLNQAVPEETKVASSSAITAMPRDQVVTARKQMVRFDVRDLGRKFNSGRQLKKLEKSRIVGKRTVQIDTNSFIADPVINLKRRRVRVQLPQESVRALIDGKPLVVTLPQKNGIHKVTIVGRRRKPVPSVDQWLIDDTAAFLANPVIPSTHGRMMRLRLSRDEVESLRTGSVTRLSAGGRDVTVIPQADRAVKTSEMRSRNGGPPERDPVYHNAGGTENRHEPVPTTPARATTTSAEGGSANLPSPTSGTSHVTDVVVRDRTIPVSLFLPWEQIWTLQGYTRGRLLQSIGLAPLEETTIEVFSWDRRRRSLDQTASAETEQFGETTDTTRDASSVYNQLQTDKEFELQGGGGVKATYKYGDMLTVEAEGHINASNKEKLSQLGKRSQDRLQESVIRASTRVKASRTTKISESQESGREDRVTRRLKNPNSCHALTINFFDVHASYNVLTKFMPDDTRLCILIDNPVNYSFEKAVDTDLLIVRTHETTLRAALLDPALTPGFDALRQIEARRIAMSLLKEADEARREEQNQANANAGQGGSGGGSTEVQTAEAAVTKAAKKIADTAKTLRDASFEELMEAVDDKPESEWREKMKTLGPSAQQWLFTRLFKRAAQSLFSECLALVDLSDAALLAASQSLNSAINANNTLSRDALLNPTPSEVNALLTPLVQAHYNTTPEWAWWWGFFEDNSLRVPDDGGLLGSLDTFRGAYSALVSAQARAANSGGPGSPGGSANTRVDALSSADRLEMAFPVGETATATERAETLMAHLQEFKNYYNYAILNALPPVELLEKLTKPLTDQSVTVGMFEPRVVAMRGGKIAIPLLADVSPTLQSLLDSIVTEVKKAKESTRRVTLPTAGLVTDVRLGVCSACERHIENLQALELRAGRARVVLDELEGARRRALLEKNPPDLGPTTLSPAALGVRVETVKENS
jgi:hypothetical protein